MDYLSIILIAFCLSADAFAVAVTNGICSKVVTKMNAFATAATFGLFQAAMPVLGYILGHSFSNVLSKFQHWIALFLLSIIGISMLAEAIKERKEQGQTCSIKNLFTVKNLTLQGIATSIDALAAGVSFGVMGNNIVISALLIGVITFICCAIGIYIGRKFGSLLGLRAKFVGGILLIAIGLKIFIEHQLQL